MARARKCPRVSSVVVVVVVVIVNQRMYYIAAVKYRGINCSGTVAGAQKIPSVAFIVVVITCLCFY